MMYLYTEWNDVTSTQFNVIGIFLTMFGDDKKGLVIRMEKEINIISESKC